MSCAHCSGVFTKPISNYPYHCNEQTKGMNVLFKNRVTEMLGVEIPVVQAPMGWIARSQLASAVSNAGGLGIIETSSGELDAVRVQHGTQRRAAFDLDSSPQRLQADLHQVSHPACPVG